MSAERDVLLNLRDSVSRIVDNLQFTSIDEAAHTRLVGLVADKLFSMSHTCRALLENSGRSAISLNSTVDMKHLYRIHRVNLQSLVDYTQQVRPFPPKKCDIHGELAALKLKNQTELDEVSSRKKRVPRQKKPAQPMFSLPRFDDMSFEDLGFCDDEDESSMCDTPPITSIPPPPTPPSSLIPTTPPSKSLNHNSLILLPPPPPPPPIPPVFFYSPPRIDHHHHQKMSPQFFDPIPLPVPRVIAKCVSNDPAPIEKFKMFKPDPPLITPEKLAEERPRKSEYFKKKLEKTPSNSSINGPPKMTKKRLMQSNYERRLRNEQMAKEEKKKEKLMEKRRVEREKSERKSMEKEEKMIVESRKEKTKFKERVPSLVFKFKKEVIDEMIRKDNAPKPVDIKPEPLSPFDENDNKLMVPPPSKKIKLEMNVATSSAADIVVRRAPLMKMKIAFRRAEKGHMIRKVHTTKFRDINGKWTPHECIWRSTCGVYSKTEFPYRPPKRPSIPKMKLIKISGNLYSKLVEK